MKLQIKILPFVVLLTLFSSLAWGAVKYGRATIQKGNVVIVREGKMYLFTTTNNPVTLYENDTIRTLKNTALSFQHPDRHKVVLGSNAIMQLKKWKKKQQQGTIRMLFGKFRARTAAVRKRSSLHLRTTTATIGIKGSLGEGATNSDFTSLSNLSGEMSLTNNAGNNFTIPVGQFGFNVDGGDQTVSLETNPDYEPGKSEDDMETGNVDQLDTGDSKEIDLPPVIEEAIDDNVVELADALSALDEDTEDDSRFSTIPDLNDERDALQETASEATPTIKATITIED